MRFDQRSAGARILCSAPHLVQRQPDAMFLGADQGPGRWRRAAVANIVQQLLHDFQCHHKVAARQRQACLTFQRVWHLGRDVDLASERLDPLERFLRRGPVTEGEL